MSIDNTASLAFGTVLLAEIPYVDQIQTKRRPAVVVSSPALHSCYNDVVLLSITSNMELDLPLKNLDIIGWEAAGLPKPSKFKPALFTLSANQVDKVFGALSNEDNTRLKSLLGEMLELS